MVELRKKTDKISKVSESVSRDQSQGKKMRWRI
jgi:hypothetical protein